MASPEVKIPATTSSTARCIASFVYFEDPELEAPAPDCLPDEVPATETIAVEGEDLTPGNELEDPVPIGGENVAAEYENTSPGGVVNDLAVGVTALEIKFEGAAFVR